MNWWLAAGSLAAVLMLAGIARLLGLGGGRIADAQEAMAAAEAAVAGFDAISATVAPDGQAATVQGHDGTSVELRMKGARIVAYRATAPVMSET